MATSLSQLLDGLAETATRTERTSAARADAATALGQLGRALDHLQRDGLHPVAGVPRERQVAALATACRELSRRSPVNEGSMAMLAAASADSLAVLHHHTTVRSRWAVATVLADAVTPLAELVGHGSPIGVAARVEQVRRHAAGVQQAAALQPPSRADAGLLDRPFAGPGVPTGNAPEHVVPDAVAKLLSATGDPVEHPSVAQVLAYTLAAESLSGAAQRLDTVAPMGTGHLAAPAWRAVREALRPYDDGSRRRHPHAPPAVDAALRMHNSLNSLSVTAPFDTGTRGVVAAAAQHLPTLASQLLYCTVRAWAADGSLVAYARDLPPREERVTAYLRGYQPAGLLRANAGDLQPVVGALHNARLLSLAVAIRAGEQSGPGFPRRAHAANQELLERPAVPGALVAATLEAGRQLLLGRHQPPGPARAR